MKQVLQAPPPSALKATSSQDVRNKFFNMIGIEAKLPPKSALTSNSNYPERSGSMPPSCSISNVIDKDWVHPRSQKVALLQESLKYDRVADDLYSLKRRKTGAPNESPSRSNKKRLDFNETVEVVPIPMRNEYSNRVRSRLWSNAVEIHENAARNSIEFAAEGWEWRSVTEDERMYVCVATGELIHPCHYEADFNPDTPENS